jgi:hypothetical protein
MRARRADAIGRGSRTQIVKTEANQLRKKALS